jgi:long-chain acyl-CoA synthetase
VQATNWTRFTSGTAGEPKAAMLTHGNLVANLRQMQAVPDESVHIGDVALATVPLFHIFGLNVVLGLSLISGAALVLEERFDAAGSLADVLELGVTILFGVPTMFALWSETDPPSGVGDGGGLRSVRRAISGASALPASVATGFEARFGVALWQGYGLTEASPGVATSLGTRRRSGSVGHPLPGVELRLVDGSGHDVLAGDPGEIWVRGPNVFSGYWRDEPASARALSDDGWLRTGDVGVVGEEGELFVVERSKDLIIVSGFNVYPGEVERVVAQLPKVEEAVALGVPDPTTGEAIEVVIVRREGCELTADEVKAHCVSQLVSYKCPTSVRFVAELPRGLSGKALRRALRVPPD